MEFGIAPLILAAVVAAALYTTVDESVLVLLDTGGSVLWARMPIFACHVDPPESSVKLILRDPEIATASTYATASPEQHSLTVSGLEL